MARYRNLDEQLADLDIAEEENEDFTFEGDVEEEVNKYELCLVGRYLTEKNINMRAMMTKMANVWKPTMGDKHQGDRPRNLLISVLSS